MSVAEVAFGSASRLAGVPARSIGEFADTVKGWLLLVAIDLLVKLGGFDRFYRIIGAASVRGTAREADRPRIIGSVCGSLDRAATCYFKRARCLQRSAASVWFLRRRGIPAELVIGVNKFPFYAHAWAEVGGTVVNDDPTVRERYQEISRC
jgi:hypothetical protein